MDWFQMIPSSREDKGRGWGWEAMGVRGRKTSVSTEVTKQTPFGHRFDRSNKITCHRHQQQVQMPRWLEKEEGPGREEREEVSTLSQDRSLAPHPSLNNRDTV